MSWCLFSLSENVWCLQYSEKNQQLQRIIHGWTVWRASRECSLHASDLAILMSKVTHLFLLKNYQSWEKTTGKWLTFWDTGLSVSGYWRNVYREGNKIVQDSWGASYERSVSKVSLVCLPSVSENLLRCSCFVAVLLSETLGKIFRAPGLDYRTYFTAEFQHLLLPPALYIACPWDLSGTQPVSSCIVFFLSTSMFPGKCAFQCVFMITDVVRECIPEVNPKMNLEVQKLKASASPAVPTIASYCSTGQVPYWLGWAVYYFHFYQE